MDVIRWRYRALLHRNHLTHRLLIYDLVLLRWIVHLLIQAGAVLFGPIGFEDWSSYRTSEFGLFAEAAFSWVAEIILKLPLLLIQGTNDLVELIWMPLTWSQRRRWVILEDGAWFWGRILLWLNLISVMILVFLLTSFDDFAFNFFIWLGNQSRRLHFRCLDFIIYWSVWRNIVWETVVLILAQAIHPLVCSWLHSVWRKLGLDGLVNGLFDCWLGSQRFVSVDVWFSDWRVQCIQQFAILLEVTDFLLLSPRKWSFHFWYCILVLAGDGVVPVSITPLWTFTFKFGTELTLVYGIVQVGWYIPRIFHIRVVHLPIHPRHPGVSHWHAPWRLLDHRNWLVWWRWLRILPRKRLEWLECITKQLRSSLYLSIVINLRWPECALWTNLFFEIGLMIIQIEILEYILYFIWCYSYLLLAFGEVIIVHRLWVQGRSWIFVFENAVVGLVELLL